MNLKNGINLLITKHKVQPVGNGKIDMIIEKEFVDGFIK